MACEDLLAVHRLNQRPGRTKAFERCAKALFRLKAICLGPRRCGREKETKPATHISRHIGPRREVIAQYTNSIRFENCSYFSTNPKMITTEFQAVCIHPIHTPHHLEALRRFNKDVRPNEWLRQPMNTSGFHLQPSPQWPHEHTLCETTTASLRGKLHVKPSPNRWAPTERMVFVSVPIEETPHINESRRARSNSEVEGEILGDLSRMMVSLQSFSHQTVMAIM